MSTSVFDVLLISKLSSAMRMEFFLKIIFGFLASIVNVFDYRNKSAHASQYMTTSSFSFDIYLLWSLTENYESD